MSNERRAAFLLRSALITAALGTAVGLLFWYWLPAVVAAVVAAVLFLSGRVLHEKIDRDFDRRYPADTSTEPLSAQFITRTLADDVRDRPTATPHRPKTQPRSTTIDTPAIIHDSDGGSTGGTCD